MKLYMAVTRDKYELPYAVEQTPSDLAKAIGVKKNTVIKAICLGTPGYVTVDVDVEDGELIAMRPCKMCGREIGVNAHPRKRFCDACYKERAVLSRKRSEMR